jgi:hypothetical protein
MLEKPPAPISSHGRKVNLLGGLRFSISSSKLVMLFLPVRTTVDIV